jgi:hypothetical protein
MQSCLKRLYRQNIAHAASRSFHSTSARVVASSSSSSSDDSASAPSSASSSNSNARRLSPKGKGRRSWKSIIRNADEGAPAVITTKSTQSALVGDTDNFGVKVTTKKGKDAKVQTIDAIQHLVEDDMHNRSVDIERKLPFVDPMHVEATRAKEVAFSRLQEGRLIKAANEKLFLHLSGIDRVNAMIQAKADPQDIWAAIGSEIEQPEVPIPESSMFRSTVRYSTMTTTIIF